MLYPDRLLVPHCRGQGVALLCTDTDDKPLSVFNRLLQKGAGS